MLFHSITEIRIAIPVLDGFPHDAPKASEDTVMLQNKSIAPGKATHSKKTKSVMHWQKTGNLKTLCSLSILYMRKGQTIFPFISQFHVHSLH